MKVCPCNFGRRQELLNLAAWLAISTGLAAGAAAQPAAKPVPRPKVLGHWGEDAIGFRWEEADSRDGRWNETDVGQFLALSLPTPGGTIEKALAIKVGERDEATVCYDTGRVAMRAAWSGGFLKFDPARFGFIAPPTMAGQSVFSNEVLESWESGVAGQPAPPVRYRGLFLHGRRVVLKYEIGETPVLESPWLDTADGLSVIVRTLEIGAVEQPLILNLLDAKAGQAFAETDATAPIAGFEHAGRATAVAVIGGNGLRPEATAAGAGVRVQLRLPPRTAPLRIKLLIWSGATADRERFTAMARGSRAAESLAPLLEPGERRWKETVVTRGKVAEVVADAKDKLPHVIDTLTLPTENPYKALLFVGGHDFFSTLGQAAICTAHGDVWTIEGIDERLERLNWRRFATGMFQPLGLRIVGDRVFVLGRDQITRLHDRNGDGEVDFYECFSNGWRTSPGGHDYSTCLETDSRGNFYFASPVGIHRVAADGSRAEVIATGWRNPNGLSIGPNDEITIAPQEGEWTPASGVFLAREGDHGGYGGPRITAERPLGYDPPLCWIPRLVDNSTGGQTWVTSDRWGPLGGQLLNFSFGRCWLLLTLREQVGDVWQGGSVKTGLTFDSGAMRGRFSPHDGQLYVSGLKGWASSAVQDGCLQRVRYTGGKVLWPIGLNVVANGVVLRFAEPLDPDTASDPGSFSLQQWNYLYAATYGSPEYKVSNPRQEGRDDVEVFSSSLLEDGRSVFLELARGDEKVKPVMQMSIAYSLKTADGTPMENTIFNTIHAVPNSRIEPRVGDRPGSQPQLSREVRERLRPGLAVYFDATKSEPQRTQRTQSITAEEVADDARVVRMAAMFVSRGHSPSAFAPLADDGQFHAKFVGFVRMPLRGAARFRIEATGAARLSVNGKPVEFAPTESGGESQAVELAGGFNALKLDWENMADRDSHLRLFWQPAGAVGWQALPPTSLWHDPAEPQLAAAILRNRGRELFADFRCGRCHTPNVVDRSATNRGFAERTTTFPAGLDGPDLRQVGSRLQPAWIAAWLRDPRAMDGHATMPRLPLTEDQTTAIAVWLATLKTPAEHSGDGRGEKQDRTEGNEGNEEGSKSGERLWENLGCIACHSFAAPGESDEFERHSLHFVGSKFLPDALQPFLLKPHANYAASRMPDFKLSAEEAAALAEYITSRAEGKLPSPAPTSSPPDAQLGRRLFAEVGCASCHRVSEEKISAKETPLTATSRGCLGAAAEPRGRAPLYGFNVSDRAALVAFLAADVAWSANVPSDQLAEHSIRRLNCAACHPRDAITPPLPEVLFEEGSQGTIPEQVPSLTWAGEKLYSSWTRDFIAEKITERPRPWMKARMPHFPADAETLALGLAAQHGLGPSSSPLRPSSTPTLSASRELGRQLTLATALNCRQCHGLRDEVLDMKNLAYGVGLSYIRDRLRRDYYDRWMRDPLAIEPGTKMPRFSEDGRTTKAAHILDGDAKRQFDAIWEYLQAIGR